MKRRDFLKTSASLSLMLTSPISLSTNENTTRKFNVKYMFNIKYYEKQ